MEPTDVEPASPCKRQCQLSECKFCIACGRSIDEISGWRTMTVAQKQQCIEDAAGRLDLMGMMLD
ncbi:hypothetical protein WJ96_06710 [Burkholderia ubonensis]|uniref:DUF1289 domain-containing protein n=1 Tax=Burkholderia ubonensis TaxID=101571 RepID=A0AAW3MWM3_9BURK|nr:DUF1289 domain-containing protein [Burkholderia ubonensis]KVP75407.1 hypothetical protein WJ93_08510 [Burkholderia ubonensis]KVP96871.1 hypothetical protein WJ97_13625 [Burkholderia ubonensis]KVP98219.1 hypothetical protein WJ96_06710 [Burkholderia ubonensis]KVZ92916.1 hypothetical protein WL25_18370 [Burkholderia ubonensis]